MAIKFYFDFASPYSYLAAMSLLGEDCQIKEDLLFCPVSVGAVIEQVGSIGPGLIPAKRNYLYKDFLRKAKSRNLAVLTPQNLPINSLMALRVSLKSVALHHQKKIIEILFKAIYEQQKDVSTFELIREILSAHFSGEQLLELENRFNDRQVVRVQYKKIFEEAIEEGVFGVPTFQVGNEIFWGDDSIPLLNQYLNGQDRFNLEEYQNYLSKF